MKEILKRKPLRILGCAWICMLSACAQQNTSKIEQSELTVATQAEETVEETAPRPPGRLDDAHIVPTGYDLRTIYVDANNGNDQNKGFTEEEALASIAAAVAITKPGDSVFVKNGTYRNESGKHLAFIETSGNAKNWIRFANYPNHKPFLKVSSHGGFYIHGASYILIDGFTLEGPQNKVKLEEAIAEKENQSNPVMSNTGIAVKPRKLGEDEYRYAHHLVFQNNEAYKFNCNGIGIARADYILVQNNTVHHNAFYSPWACSGISTLGNWNFDNRTDRYRAIIRNNRSYKNYNFIEFWQQKKITDGNGIIADLLNAPYAMDGYDKPFSGYALIENNIIYENGGRGLNMYHSHNVDIINNTTYHNGRHPEINTELGIGKSDRIQLINNVFVTHPKSKVFLYYGSDDIRIENNVFAGSENFAAPRPDESNIVQPDIPYIAPQEENFRLLPQSKALGASLTDWTPRVNHYGKQRATNDLGAL